MTLISFPIRKIKTKKKDPDHRDLKNLKMKKRTFKKTYEERLVYFLKYRAPFSYAYKHFEQKVIIEIRNYHVLDLRNSGYYFKRLKKKITKVHKKYIKKIYIGHFVKSEWFHGLRPVKIEIDEYKSTGLPKFNTKFLKKLTIRDCKTLQKIPKNLKIEYLEIRNCEQLFYDIEPISSLKILDVHEPRYLDFVSENIEHIEIDCDDNVDLHRLNIPKIKKLYVRSSDCYLILPKMDLLYLEELNTTSKIINLYFYPNITKLYVNNNDILYTYKKKRTKRYYEYIDSMSSLSHDINLKISSFNF